MLAIAAAMLLAAFLRGRRQDRIPPLDRKDLEWYRRASEQKCRDWRYPFE
jgi:hypothetical protein